jgi:competence ComEA-like helix-hairpin-helix protein
MWGREMRAGLVFVLVSLLAGGAFREWRRSHETRFEDLVAGLESRDAATARQAARTASPDSGGGDPSLGAAPSGRLAGGIAPRRGRGSAGGRGPALVPSRIDLDRATARDLERLPGIGPALAARIIADRSERGAFRSPDALLRVRGIGPRTLERIRPYLAAPVVADSGSPIAN